MYLSHFTIKQVVDDDAHWYSMLNDDDGWLFTYPQHPTPYTLHLTFYTLPYTLHSSPETLHPTPYTLPLKPYTLHPTPYTLHPTPYTPNHYLGTRNHQPEPGDPARASLQRYLAHKKTPTPLGPP